MSITKKQLIDLIHKISENLDNIPLKLSRKQHQIDTLRQENEELKQINKNIFDQVKKYVKELEQIKKHYVNSNNKTGQ